jgi:glutamate carboxypeptidase
VGGGSDGNFTAGLGVATLDGLGPLGDGAHAPHEWVRLESIVERSKLAAGLIERLRTVGEATYTRHGAVADWSTQ